MKIETVLGAPPELGIGNNAYPVQSEHLKGTQRCGYETIEKSQISLECEMLLPLRFPSHKVVEC